MFSVSLLLKNPQGDFITAIDKIIHTQNCTLRNQDIEGRNFIMHFTIFKLWVPKTETTL